MSRDHKRLPRYRAKVATATGRLLSNSFEMLGQKPVFWSAICWDAVKAQGERAVIRPFSTQQRAEWAEGVLTAHYPDRHYALIREVSQSDVSTAQMEVFENAAMDDVFALELGKKYSASPD